MGLRGPAPKPKAIRIAEGCAAHRPLPANEPDYEPAVPDKPKRMSRQASRVWDELVNEMAGFRVLRRVDKRALWHLAEDEALVAEAYQGLWKLAAEVKERAATSGKELPGNELISLLSTSAGRMAMRAVRDLAARVIIERREFGFTPSSRTRIEVIGDDRVDNLEALLCGPRLTPQECQKWQ